MGGWGVGYWVVGHSYAAGPRWPWINFTCRAHLPTCTCLFPHATWAHPTSTHATPTQHTHLRPCLGQLSAQRLHLSSALRLLRHGRLQRSGQPLLVLHQLLLRSRQVAVQLHLLRGLPAKRGRDGLGFEVGIGVGIWERAQPMTTLRGPGSSCAYCQAHSMHATPHPHHSPPLTQAGQRTARARSAPRRAPAQAQPPAPPPAARAWWGERSV